MIGVNEGIINLEGSDDELAFVLAHELGHLVAGHPRKKRNYGTLFTLQVMPWILTPPMLFFDVTLLYLAWSAIKLLHETEREADWIALLSMTEAGYDPTAAIAFFEHTENYKEQRIQRRFTAFHAETIGKIYRKAWRGFKWLISPLGSHPRVCSFSLCA